MERPPIDLKQWQEEAKCGVPPYGITCRRLNEACDYALSLEADLARWQNIALRQNKSGCCCKLNEAGDEVIEACALHREWKEGGDAPFEAGHD